MSLPANKNESGHEKTCLMSYANNKGADQPAHPRCLINAFVVRCLDSVMSLVSVTKISSLMLASVAEQASLSLTWSETPEDTFSHDEAQMHKYCKFQVQTHHSKFAIHNYEFAGKELSPWLFTCAIFYFSAVLSVPFPFGVFGRMWNSIVSIPDHCLFIYLGTVLRI